MYGEEIRSIVRKHPGILFTLYVNFVSFWLGYFLVLLNLPRMSHSTILILWYGVCLYGIAYYHGKWVENQFRKHK